MMPRTRCSCAASFSAGSVLLVPLVAVLAGARFLGADSATWDLRTDDTEIRLGIADQRPVVQRLAAVGATQPWIDTPSPVPLMSKVWWDGRETPLAGTFQKAAFDPQAGQLTLRVLNGGDGHA